MFLAEVAPAAPVLVPLTALVALLVALGLVMLAHEVVGALFGVAKSAVGWIPWLGKKAEGGVHRVEQRLNNYLTDAITGLEAAVASSWHSLASATAHLGYTIAHLARATAHIAWYVASKYSLEALAFRAGKALYNTHLEQKILKLLQRQTRVIVRELEHPTAGPIAAGVKAGTKGIDAGLERLEHWTIPRVRAAEHAIDVTIPGELGRLRARDLSLGRAYDALRRLLKRHERLLGASAITAGVAYALARLGGGWIRCTNWRKAGRSVCRMDPSILDDLLLGTLLVVGTISITEFARELQGVMGEATDGIRGLIRE